MPWCLGSIGISAREQHCEIRLVGPRGPDLLAGDHHPVFAVRHRPGGQRGEVRTRPGSLNSWHHFSSLRTMGGRKRRRCSSVPWLNRRRCGVVQAQWIKPGQTQRGEDGLDRARDVIADARARRVRAARSAPPAPTWAKFGYQLLVFALGCGRHATPQARRRLQPATARELWVATHCSTAATASAVLVVRR